MAKMAKKITERQARILAAIVKEYSNSGEPIGSEEIQDKYDFGVSSATIRNEMVALEKSGYIEQPHTSAGRVPTDIGYRYFVSELMKRFEMSLKEQKLLRQQLSELHQEHQEFGKRIARLLAQKTEQAAFALLPEEASSAGLSNIFQSASFQNTNAGKQDMVEMVQFFENIDEYAGKMLTKFLSEKPEALIGSEHHLPQISNYSLIVSKVNLPDGKTGLIGIIGPKSMRYDKNISVVDYFSKFLSSGMAIALLIHWRF